MYIYMDEENFIKYLSGEKALGFKFKSYLHLIQKFPCRTGCKIRAKIQSKDVTSSNNYCINVQKFLLNVKKNWCVGYTKAKSNYIKFEFEIDGTIKNSDYVIMYNITVNKKDFFININPDYIIIKKFEILEFEEILQVEGTWIKKRLEKNIDFIDKIKDTVQKQILNNNIYLNVKFEI
ncbi:MAG: hypothetical protein LKF87_10225 [Clostridium tyrobutyricum]|jgi:hypothetical protein|uniref:hypothetical protein n=1 Tax=Clostridium tyrobutyricum TaxID=1519 RepID=UPI00242ECA35|nr:hypothetical protein [Clostridium tyrobutyricum]MCH4200132.1 hypothetical protein [Clostridium tyrobutyricum]MCH4238233.1 hypothetical protein [Clostridium tyrobutyricum]MCH4259326.1 hypothetical protein [Clostridium tyrobutyricum]